MSCEPPIIACDICTYENCVSRQSCEMCGEKLVNQNHQTNQIDKNNKIDTDLIKLLLDESLNSLETIKKNKEEAYEIIPETFFNVSMLHLPVEINGILLEALVDTGAQITVISRKCAEKCGISNLIDKSYKGMAKGVGQSEIIGKIWMVDIILGKHALPCSFSVIEGVDFDMLFGLNILMKYGCNIDLKKMCIKIDQEEIKFI